MSGKDQLGLVNYGHEEWLVGNIRSLSRFSVIKQKKQLDYNDAGQWIMNIRYVLEFLLIVILALKLHSLWYTHTHCHFIK